MYTLNCRVCQNHHHLQLQNNNEKTSLFITLPNHIFGTGYDSQTAHLGQIHQLETFKSLCMSMMMCYKLQFNSLNSSIVSGINDGTGYVLYL